MPFQKLSIDNKIPSAKAHRQKEALDGWARGVVLSEEILVMMLYVIHMLFNNAVRDPFMFSTLQYVIQRKALDQWAGSHWIT